MVRLKASGVLLVTSLTCLTTTTYANQKEPSVTNTLVSKAERIKRTETHARRAEEINQQSENETNQKRAEDTKRKEDETKRQQEEEKAAQEKANQEKRSQEKATQPVATPQATTPVAHDDPRFGSNGLLIMEEGGNARQVYNLIKGIPGGMNGGDYHIQTGLDNLIDTLTTPQAFWVLYTLEGPGFGQLADGYAGYDTHESHQALITNQLNSRFQGSIHNLLKKWGTYAYNGY